MPTNLRHDGLLLMGKRVPSAGAHIWLELATNWIGRVSRLNDIRKGARTQHIHAVRSIFVNICI